MSARLYKNHNAIPLKLSFFIVFPSKTGGILSHRPLITVATAKEAQQARRKQIIIHIFLYFVESTAVLVV
jgi:hypothetical protein